MLQLLPTPLQLSLALLLPLLPRALRAAEQGIQALHARQVDALCAGDAHRVAEDDLELEGAPALPVEQHAGLAADVALGAGEDLVRAREVRREGAAQHARRGVPDLGHEAAQVAAQLRVAHHVGVAAAARQHRRRIHGRVDRQLVPAHRLQPDLVRRLDVADPAQRAPPRRQLLDGRRAAPLERRARAGSGGRSAVRGAARLVRRRRVRVRAQVHARPAVLAHRAGGGLLGADDRDGADDGRRRVALAVGVLDADPVLDQHDHGRGADQRRDQGRLVAAVGQGLGRDDDEVPLPRAGG